MWWCEEIAKMLAIDVIFASIGRQILTEVTKKMSFWNATILEITRGKLFMFKKWNVYRTKECGRGQDLNTELLQLSLCFPKHHGIKIYEKNRGIQYNVPAYIYIYIYIYISWHDYYKKSTYVNILKLRSVYEVLIFHTELI
jgi:hypothetical protein